MPARLLAATTIGTGPSSGNPPIFCFVDQQVNQYECDVCTPALDNFAADGHRLNPSLLLEVETAPGGERKNILIDAGKTMRSAIFKFFYPRKVRQLDGLIVTHDHMDAMLGIPECEALAGKKAIPLWTDQHTMKSINRVFPEGAITHQEAEAEAEAASGSNNNNSLERMRWVPHELELEKVFEVGGGLQILPFHVEHGKNYPCLGFLISIEADGRIFEGCSVIAYISDTGGVPEDKLQLIAKYKVKTLILDLLGPYTSAPFSHFSRPQAVEMATRMEAEQTFFTGTGHNINRDVDEKKLHNVGNVSMRYARDGMKVFEM